MTTPPLEDNIEATKDKDKEAEAPKAETSKAEDETVVEVKTEEVKPTISAEQQAVLDTCSTNGLNAEMLKGVTAKSLQGFNTFVEATRKEAARKAQILGAQADLSSLSLDAVLEKDKEYQGMMNHLKISGHDTPSAEVDASNKTYSPLEIGQMKAGNN